MIKQKKFSNYAELFYLIYYSILLYITLYYYLIRCISCHYG